MIALVLVGLAQAAVHEPVAEAGDDAAIEAGEAGDDAAIEAGEAGEDAAIEAGEDSVEVIAMTREQAWAMMDPAELLTQAIAFQEIGRRQAALDRLEVLERIAPSVEVDFQRGKTLELMEDYDGALQQYEDILATEPHRDAAFRRAIVLEDLGRHEESLAQVRALQKAQTWSEADALTLSLARGIAELSAGKSRKGIRRIDAALAALEGSSEAPWMQARARSALATWQLEQAAGLVLKGNRKAAKRIQERAELMIAAEQQVIAIANLGEPEYALRGLILLGDAYLSLHDDLLAAPVPRRLDAEQEAIYVRQIEQRAAILRAKAKNYYGEGIKLARRVGWEGALSEALIARHEGV